MIHDDDIILVEVDGQAISLPMLEYMMRQRGVSEEDHDGMRAIMDELIRLRVVASAAEREGLADEPEVRAARMLRDLEALRIRYFTHIFEAFPVTDEDVQRVYEAQVARAGDRQFAFDSLLFATQSQALLALAALEDGEAGFDAMADSESFRVVAADRLGWVDRSQLGEEIAAALTDLELGEIIGVPLQTEQGWRVLRLAEERPLEAPPLESVREGISRQLVRQRLEAVVEDLYDAAQITPMLPLEPAAGH
ncbi:MAG: peptidylprolyl isomerase [Wenzhouxiangella sp.]